jgi:F0F1-type ATP synthase membrane subunit b/b'
VDLWDWRRQDRSIEHLPKAPLSAIEEKRSKLGEMKAFFVTFALFLMLTLVTAGTGWNVDKAKVNVAVANVAKSDRVRRAREKSKELKAKAREVRDAARTRASELLAQAKGKSSTVQESTKKRAESLLSNAKCKAKELEEKAKKALENA